MKFILCAIFLSIFLVGCSTNISLDTSEDVELIESQVVTQDPILVEPLESKLYAQVLLLEDISGDFYPVGRAMDSLNVNSVDPIIYSIAQKYSFVDGYVVNFGSKWSGKRRAYEDYFRQYVLEFPSEDLAHRAFMEANISFFTGSLDALGTSPKYSFTEDESVRVLVVRIDQVDAEEVSVLRREGKYILGLEVNYLTNDRGSDYYRNLIDSAVDRIANPSSLQQDPGFVYNKLVEDSAVLIKETDNFTVYISDIRIQDPGNSSATIMDMFKFTIHNKQNYPFYPVYSYYVRKSLYNVLPSEAYAKWVFYSNNLLETDTRETIVFNNPTVITFDEDGTSVFKIEILDARRGRDPFTLEKIEIPLNIYDYVETK